MKLTRKLISKNENKVSWLQIIGFVLVLIGVFLLLLSLTPMYSLTGENLSILFFVIMLGVAFAFPSLLKDQNKGLSTMRIAVFMMVNVICILFLKIGWPLESLDKLGVNGYWMGIIAFIFGSKATQSFFESRMADPKNFLPNAFLNNISSNNVGATNTLNAADAVRTAIAQNQDLKTKYPNIVSILFGSMNANGHNIFCVDIHLNDNNTANIPAQLPVIINGQQSSVPTNIIIDIGSAKTNAARGDRITNQTIGSAPGTLGCFLTDQNQQTIYALSCCHVFTNDQWLNFSGNNVPNNPINQISNSNTGQQIGNWSFGIMNSSFDIAYATVNNPTSILPSVFKKARDVQDIDILHKTAVTFVGATSGNSAGFICNYDCTRNIGYSNISTDLNNLILISNNGTSPSAPGDSGALVYTINGNEPIGIVVANDLIFSYLIPITNILSITGKFIY